MTQFLSEKFVDAENRASSHQLPHRTSLIYQSFDQHFLKNLAEPQKGAQKVILKANNTLLSSSRYMIFSEWTITVVGYCMEFRPKMKNEPF